MQGAVSTAPECTRWVREERMRSGNAADDRSWTGSESGRLGYTFPRHPAESEETPMPQIRHPHHASWLKRGGLLVVAFATLLPLPALARPFTFSGSVISVHDGDTISVVSRTHVEKVRLAGIDCPELRQAFGPRAKQFTSRLAFGQMVMVRVRDIDPQGRKIGDVTLPDGRSLSRELVAAGFAWRSTKSSKNKELARLERDARRMKRGLWADAHPEPPWEFRRVNKAER